MEIATTEDFPPIIIDAEGKRADHILEITHTLGYTFYATAFGGSYKVADASPMTKEEAIKEGERLTKPRMGGFPGYPSSNLNMLVGFEVIALEEA